MLNKKKNAFTITELVIVIAVIAILAAVLIPTFSSVVDKANESAAMQEALNTVKEYLIEDSDATDLLIENGGYKFYFVGGEMFTVTDVALAEGDATQGTYGDPATTITYADYSEVKTVKDVTIKAKTQPQG